MKLYTITVRGAVLDWAGTQADAKAATKEQQKNFSQETVTWQAREVPVDKACLLAFLKENCTTQGSLGE